MKTNIIQLSKANSLELHYWFNDESHSMDAYVQNRCENEFLGILREIALKFEVEVVVETEPIGEGGLRRWFNVISKEENKKGAITSAIVASVIAVILSTPLSKITEKVIDKIFEDTEMHDLEKEKIKLEIEKLKRDLISGEDELQQSTVIKKRKSNFYSFLEAYSKVDKVSIATQDKDKVTIAERVVNRSEFKEFILVSDDLEPIEISEAVIEIISPVLKKGKYKWMGIYKGKVIPFIMKSVEFKSLVQSGKIQFKNGTSINCHIILSRQIDNEGLEKITKYEVTRVDAYFENDHPIETPEGKSYRQRKEANKNQFKLFNPDDLVSE